MRPLQVLLVEDELLIAMLFAEVLEDMGHTVCAMESSEADAVAAAAKFNPDLIIADAKLRKGSGIAALATILLSGHVPHMFVSGDVSSVRAARPDAIVMQKPFFAADLARAVELAMDAKAAGA
ncbi:response regulator [Hyphomicrobium sp. MC1]|uniref:response regulator n=1 Tax=Hyphomicrobium sp. (strain MC1) TaxID=717785 RepID=UPI000213E698|nr:response regulator [Hyphomicrobium sp. MC1]CCB66517.1 Response regulator receiver [Hyphomicrobium sp. MC1]